MRPLESVAVVPGHPLRRIFFHLVGVPLQLCEIVEGIGAAQLGAMDQTHEQVAHLGAIFRQIEQTVFPMENRLLQTPFADVVIEGRTGLAQEQRQALPVIKQLHDGSAQTGVRLDLLLIQLRVQPLVQLVHHRTAALLVEDQPFFR